MIAGILHKGWQTVCLAFLAIMVGLRALRYGPFSLSEAHDATLGEAMVQVGNWFIWPWAITNYYLLYLVLALPVMLVLLRRHLFLWDGVRWRFRPLLISLICAGAAWLHYLFDSSPAISFHCLVLLVLVLPALGDEKTRFPLRSGATRATFWTGWGLCALLLILAGHDFADRLTLIAWASALVVGCRYGPSLLGTRDLRITAATALAPINLMPALLPLLLPLHGGLRIGDGLGYDYCEIPERNLLAVSVPRCSSIPSRRRGFEACQAGSVDFYDLDTLEQVDSYSFFSDRYYGRLEQLACVGDEIYVGVQGTNLRHRANGQQSAMSFRIGMRHSHRPLVAGLGIGTSIAYDPAHDAVFFTGEYSGEILRLDRQSGLETRRESLPRPWRVPVLRSEHSGSLVTSVYAVDPRHDRLFVWEWMQGRYAHGVDLTSLEPVVRLDVHSGSILGGTVDVERNRLLLTGLWGLEVFDLDTAELLFRRRLGFTNRPPVIDPWRNRIYIGSSIDGKIRVLDRDSFELLDQIAVGMGPRYVHLSSDGARLFGSSTRAQYVWELPPLAGDS